MIIVTQGKMRLNTCTDFVPPCTEIVLLQTEMQKSCYTNCIVFHGQTAEVAYADYIDGKRDFMEVTMDYR